ncbi:MAG: hypothetical protein KAH93_06495 [Candidatus Aenigmarchaeota archaeon]|nr:hypothetical protein [Candidatus Aenigmarchaeota archaeon]
MNRDLSKFKEYLENCLEISMKNNWGASRIGGLYGEVFVANKLLKYEPQIGAERENKNADIYLKEIGRRVEVKWASFYEKERYWSWGFGEGKQIENEKFDYCVLVASDENGKVKHCFVFTYDEMSKLKHGDKGMISQKYYITVYEGSVEYENELESDLNKNTEKYEERWDKIK